MLIHCFVMLPPDRLVSKPSLVNFGDMRMHNDDLLLRLPQVIGPYGLLPISRSAFYAGIRTGRFPKPIRLGPRTSAWSKAAIIAVIEDAKRGG